jgi:hypothetical protein
MTHASNNRGISFNDNPESQKWQMFIHAVHGGNDVLFPDRYLVEPEAIEGKLCVMQNPVRDVHGML